MGQTAPVTSLIILLLLALVASCSVAASSSTIAGASGELPPLLEWEVVSRRPHDVEAYTQGLLLDGEGALFESTGLYGRSTLRQVDAIDGVVARSIDFPDEYFAEGLVLVDDRLIQLTWLSGVAVVHDVDTFEPLEVFTYQGEGWGICYDGVQLLMSDGSDVLTARDPETFEVMYRIEVTVAGEPQRLLNELECVDGRVWANVYRSDRIVRIDPTSGKVDGILDLAGIIEPHPADEMSRAVLNGIAWDPEADTLLVTGKLWPQLIEIRVLDGAGP
jgi:glutamine cyclotransferase